MSSIERTLRRQMHRNKKAQFFRKPEKKNNDPLINFFKQMTEEQKRFMERQEELKEQRAPLVWAKMIYICDDCGARYTMYLENTLERHNGDKHKPVPFGIRCKKCGGFHCFDRSGLIELPEERYLEHDEDYFKDTCKYDCGQPVIRSYLTF